MQSRRTLRSVLLLGLPLAKRCSYRKTQPEVVHARKRVKRPLETSNMSKTDGCYGKQLQVHLHMQLQFSL
jgi:hypothetical protein